MIKSRKRRHSYYNNRRRLSRNENPEGSRYDCSKDSKLSILCLPLLVVCLAAIVHNSDNTNDSKGEEASKMLYSRKPEVLLNYNQFVYKYHQIECLEADKVKPAEDLARRIVFISDMIGVALHNHRFMQHQESYQVGQSIFESSPLKKFNGLDQSDRKDRDCEGSQSMSGMGSMKQLKSSWLITKLNGLGVARSYQIPNYPLDKQPSPDKITHIDADLRSCSSPIGDQSGCGACYAFSWCALAGWHYCKQTGEVIDFSEQHIIDCGHVAALDGCKSGRLDQVRAFTHTFGMYEEKDYPYEANEDRSRCKKHRRKEGSAYGPVEFVTLDWTRINVVREEWERTLEEQPILVQINLPGDILKYKRGIHSGDNCNPNMKHGMLLVGHGREEGKPYWLLRNSLGPSWGEGGYMRLSRDIDEMMKCFENAYISKFKFKSLTDDVYYNFYDKFNYQPSERILESDKKNKRQNIIKLANS